MDKQVSFDDEPLILVDSDDNIVGNLAKEDCHLNGGILHRAFSIFIMNSEGNVLLQKRSNQKMLWPDYWSNSCCSHPRKGETTDQAAERRLREELDLSTELQWVYKFEYRAEFGNVGTEHELCSVYVGFSDDAAKANANEVSELRWFSPEEIGELFQDEGAKVTPWFRMEWDVLTTRHAEALGNLPP